VDVWEMPEMDLALVEGSVCLQDEHSLKELKEISAPYVEMGLTPPVEKAIPRAVKMILNEIGVYQ